MIHSQGEGGLPTDELFPEESEQVPSSLGTVRALPQARQAPQSPAESCYLEGRCRQVGQAGSSRRARGCHPVGRSRWRVHGSLQRREQVRDPQAGVDPAIPLARSPRSPPFIPKGTAAAEGLGSGPDPILTPICSPRTPEVGGSYSSSLSFSRTPQHIKKDMPKFKKQDEMVADITVSCLSLDE